MHQSLIKNGQSGQASVEYILICGVIIGALALSAVLTHSDILTEFTDVVQKKLYLQTFILRLPW